MFKNEMVVLKEIKYCLVINIVNLILIIRVT